MGHYQPFHVSSYEAPWVGFGVGAAVEIWCRGDVRGQAP